MKIIDFLVFNLTNWYNDHQDRLTWSTPIGRATYVVGLIAIIWLFNFWIAGNIIFRKTVEFSIPGLAIAVAGIVLMQYFKYIYERKGRYQQICDAPGRPLNVSDKVGQTLSIGFAIFSLFVSGLLILFFA